MNKFVIAFFIIFSLISCTNNNEKYNGSPVGKAQFENVSAVLSTTEASALPNQEVAYTVGLPAEFRNVVTDSVAVEVTSFSPSGTLRRSKLIFTPGQSTASGKVLISGGTNIFENQIELKVTAILLYKVLPGKHYTASSNTISLLSGNSNVPTENSKRMRLAVSWENKTKKNLLACYITKVGLTSITFRGGFTNSYPITIAGQTVTANFSSSLSQSAVNFVTSCNTNIALINAGLTFDNVGSTVNVRFTGLRPTITFPTGRIYTPIFENLFNPFIATRFERVDLGIDNTFPAFIDIYNSEIIQKNGRALAEGQNNLFNAGEYLITLGATATNQLETLGADIRYRIVLRLPNGEVKVFPGVLTNPQVTTISNLRSIFKFTKTGYGDNAVYNNFQNLVP